MGKLLAWSRDMFQSVFAWKEKFYPDLTVFYFYDVMSKIEKAGNGTLPFFSQCLYFQPNRLATSSQLTTFQRDSTYFARAFR